jgi:CheY-like chemotaxis protein
LPAIDGAWNSPGLAAALGIVRGRTCAALKITAVPLDMIMPVMGGEEALRELRATSPLTPVIGSSGHSKALTNFGDKGCRVSAIALCGAGFDGMLKTSGGKPRANRTPEEKPLRLWPSKAHSAIVALRLQSFMRRQSLVGIRGSVFAP